MIISVFNREKNIVGKGEIACTSNFSFPHYVFKRLLSQIHHKVSFCGNGLIHETKELSLHHAMNFEKKNNNAQVESFWRRRTDFD